MTLFDRELKNKKNATKVDLTTETRRNREATERVEALLRRLVEATTSSSEGAVDAERG